MGECRTRVWPLVLIATACGLLSGCGTATPTDPDPVAVGYAGEWSGTTFQGRPISFTVSPEQQVTTISVGYQIDMCSGVETFSDVKGVPFADGLPAFQFTAKLADTRPIAIQGYLMPDASVSGTLLLYGPPSCGRSETVAGPFTARRR